MKKTSPYPCFLPANLFLSFLYRDLNHSSSSTTSPVTTISTPPWPTTSQPQQSLPPPIVTKMVALFSLLPPLSATATPATNPWHRAPPRGPPTSNTLSPSKLFYPFPSASVLLSFSYIQDVNVFTSYRRGPRWDGPVST